jgi:hypothetical protein
MSKHPGPWAMNEWHLYDADRTIVCEVRTDDPETRAVLPHAAEMFAVLKSIRHGNAFDQGAAFWLVDAIEAEIAKARKP